MSKQELEAKSTLALPELVTYLHELAESLRGRRVYLEKDGQVLALTPADVVELELDARQKKDKERLTIEIKWRREERAAIPTDTGLRITGELAPATSK